MFEKILYQSWWKVLTILLLSFTCVYGFWVKIPLLPILEESIRNLFFHVPMWFSMMFLMLMSLIFSLKYLVSFDSKSDVYASNFAVVGFLMGCLGILTGMVWAKVTWGAWWVFAEVKLNAAAAALLVYSAYFILRSSFVDAELKAKFSAVYSIFAFVMFMVFINVIPRLATSSLHPGNGGNPGFNSYDLDNHLRLVFYPAILGWIGIGFWLSSQLIRINLIKRKIDDID
ncbi:MAG: cytochrome c biogenesis protein [Chitinophagales bacterium]|nr:cytochrome c biogenesis protein [Chitinophagales bacterium]MCZ2394094.1 cytochrome c biogenesis protein [Chitinophagales bacterium]